MCISSKLQTPLRVGIRYSSPQARVQFQVILLLSIPYDDRCLRPCLARYTYTPLLPPDVYHSLVLANSALLFIPSMPYGDTSACCKKRSASVPSIPSDGTLVQLGWSHISVCGYSPYPPRHAGRRTRHFGTLDGSSGMHPSWPYILLTM